MNTLKKIRANQKGFTLVELIVVVAILGVLAAVAIPNYMNYLYSSRVNTDIDTARAVINVARTMIMTTGDVPASLDAVLEEADLDTAEAATGGSLGSVLSLVGDFNTDDITITVTPGEKAGDYAPDGNVTERGPLPKAVKSGS